MHQLRSRCRRGWHWTQPHHESDCRAGDPRGSIRFAPGRNVGRSPRTNQRNARISARNGSTRIDRTKSGNSLRSIGRAHALRVRLEHGHHARRRLHTAQSCARLQRRRFRDSGLRDGHSTARRTGFTGWHPARIQSRRLDSALGAWIRCRALVTSLAVRCGLGAANPLSGPATLGQR